MITKDDILLSREEWEKLPQVLWSPQFVGYTSVQYSQAFTVAGGADQTWYANGAYAWEITAQSGSVELEGGRVLSVPLGAAESATIRHNGVPWLPSSAEIRMTSIGVSEVVITYWKAVKTAPDSILEIANLSRDE